MKKQDQKQNKTCFFLTFRKLKFVFDPLFKLAAQFTPVVRRKGRFSSACDAPGAVSKKRMCVFNCTDRTNTK